MDTTILLGSPFFFPRRYRLQLLTCQECANTDELKPKSRSEPTSTAEPTQTTRAFGQVVKQKLKTAKVQLVSIK